MKKIKITPIHFLVLCTYDFCISLLWIYLYVQSNFNHSNIFGITKIYLYNFDPLKPHFYIIKLAFIGVYIIFFLFLLKT